MLILLNCAISGGTTGGGGGSGVLQPFSQVLGKNNNAIRENKLPINVLRFIIVGKPFSQEVRKFF